MELKHPDMPGTTTKDLPAAVALYTPAEQQLESAKTDQKATEDQLNAAIAALYTRPEVATAYQALLAAGQHRLDSDTALSEAKALANNYGYGNYSPRQRPVDVSAMVSDKAALSVFTEQARAQSVAAREALASARATFTSAIDAALTKETIQYLTARANYEAALEAYQEQRRRALPMNTLSQAPQASLSELSRRDGPRSRRPR